MGRGSGTGCQSLWHKLLMSSFYLRFACHAPHLSHKWNLLKRNCIKVALVVLVVVVVVVACKLFTRRGPLEWHCLLGRKVSVKESPGLRPSLPPSQHSMMSAKQKLWNKINKYAWAQKLLNWKCALNIFSVLRIRISQFLYFAFCEHFLSAICHRCRHLVRHCTR